MANRRTETSRETRSLLLAAASEMFAERGFQQTTFVDLAERSGISRGSITWHFGNKDGLLLAVVEDQAESLIKLCEQLARMKPTEIQDYLRSEDTSGDALRSSQLILALYNEALKPDSSIHEAFVDLHRRARSTIEQWAEQHLALPEGTSSADAAAALFGAGIGILIQWMIAPDLVTTEAGYRAMRTILEPMLKD